MVGEMEEMGAWAEVEAGKVKVVREAMVRGLEEERGLGVRGVEVQGVRGVGETGVKVGVEKVGRETWLG